MTRPRLYIGDYVVVSRACSNFYHAAGIRPGTIGIFERFDRASVTAHIKYPDGQVLPIFVMLVEKLPVLDSLASI